MKLETPPTFKGKTTDFRSLESWLSKMARKLGDVRINGQPLTLDTLPPLSGGSDEREWNALNGWLAMLHSQIGKPFAHGFPTVTKTTTATLRPEEMGIIYVTSAAPYTITLPPAAKMGDGNWYHFIKTDAAANAVTLDGSGAETINGAATEARIDAQYDFMIIISNGTNWLIGNIRSTM